MNISIRGFCSALQAAIEGFVGVLLEANLNVM